MSIDVTGAYIYFTIPVFGGIHVTQTMLSCLLVTVFLCTAGAALGRNLHRRPDGKQVLVEKGISLIYNMVVETMGEHNAHWMPFICTLFLSSICGSLIGMTGFLRSTTADLSTTITWALMVSAIIWYHNIKNMGFFGWLKGFTEPIAVMTPMNIISEIAQPVSLAFRHCGNVAGGGVITAILYIALSGASALLLNALSQTVIIPVLLLVIAIAVFLYAQKHFKLVLRIFAIVIGVISVLGVLQALDILSGVPILSLGVPAVLSVYFDLFSGFIQALVFSLLSMVYIAGACPPPAEKTM